ncbi:MAG: peptidylprolyl isomerase [Saprospiraceae bacterium]|nr:peptidylprolyl isomerase [Saprospiraceae bacterium]
MPFYKLLTYISLSLLLLSVACVPRSEEAVLTDIRVDLRDPIFRKIHDLQDRHAADSLYAYFRHQDPSYRYLSALAFASIRDSAALDSLYLLLADPIDQVRAAAAYAIGQIGSAQAQGQLIASFDRQDTFGLFAGANSAILEAIGKCGDTAALKALSTISTYQAHDTLLLLGQARGIYRFALRNKISKEGTARMIELASNKGYPDPARQVAANYLLRARDLKIDSVAAIPLITAFEQEPNANIRMAIAVGLGKARTQTALMALLDRLGSEPDYRVKCNIIRALTDYSYKKVQPAIQGALTDANLHVAVRAAQYFVEKGKPEDAGIYWKLAKDSMPWPVQLEMYAAANKYMPKTFAKYLDAINKELRVRFLQAQTPQAKAAALRALAQFGWNYRFIFREGANPNQHIVVRTAAVEALAGISARPDFKAFFGANHRRIAKDLAIRFKEAIRGGDPGMIAVAASALREPAREYPLYIDTLKHLDSALANLSLPREIETYNELKQTIDYLRGRKASPPKKVDYNHPIPWAVLDGLSARPEAVIATSRGEIRIRLMPEEAPGSVANFVQLAKDNFFKDKNFHRVVANFVIQGGCPRGDGYGSLDYTIRSELGPLYYDDEGYLGMASAGNHTEGTQFFITHSPTPHLDGNYTIFGKVVSGMETVHQIRAGDLITQVTVN